MRVEVFPCRRCPGAVCIQCGGVGQLVREIDETMERSARFSAISVATWASGGPPRGTYNRYQTAWALEGGWQRPWLYQNDDLKNLLEQGHSELEIATRLRRTRDGVRHQLRKLGYPTCCSVETELYIALVRSGVNRSRCTELIGRSIGERRLPPTPDEALMLRRFNEIGASNAIIAGAVGVKLSTIYRWRREYEVVRPSRSPRAASIVHRTARGRLLPDGMGGVS